MSNPQKAKGSRAERAVADYLIAQGVPCERIPAGATNDRGDLWVPDSRFPSIDVKDHRSIELAQWVDRANEQRVHAGRSAGVVWHKRRGRSNPAEWYVTTSGEGLLRLIGVK